jgi:hypothetical protein
MKQNQKYFLFAKAEDGESIMENGFDAIAAKRGELEAGMDVLKFSEMPARFPMPSLGNVLIVVTLGCALPPHSGDGIFL